MSYRTGKFSESPCKLVRVRVKIGLGTDLNLTVPLPGREAV